MKKVVLFFCPILLFSCGFRSVASWFNEGNAACRESRWQDARECYRRALDGHPDNRTAALIYRHWGDTAVGEAVALTQTPDGGDTADSGTGTAAGKNDSGLLLKEALELYCLAQLFYGEPYADAAVNAEWVRLQLKQFEDNHDETRQKKDDSGDSRDDGNRSKSGDDGKNDEHSSEESSSQSEKENESVQSDADRNGGSPSSDDSSRDGETSSDSSSAEEKNGNETQTDSLSENNSQDGPADENSQAGMSESGVSSAGEKAESAMSAEEAARMKAAVELLEQEESSRRQRPSFRRLPSYDDTEKNW